MSKSPHRFGLRIALIAALMLFFGQLGAMTHAYSHASAARPSVVHASVPGTHEFCNDCLTFAPLLATAAAPTPLPFVMPPTRGLAPSTRFASRGGHPAPLAFRSRAPPTL